MLLYDNLKSRMNLTLCMLYNQITNYTEECLYFSVKMSLFSISSFIRLTPLNPDGFPACGPSI